ncbi:WYL domain-containing protein [Gordonia desulfuricans]|uniref:WYL domain-containing protein n=1 Tax=Gordonia desulfuricans TaxID=89051 RepID=A0A7K3LU96_9ACTN|nr:WYL domain-containing protein [Gordonia desulfuricans]NDK91865.1 WYL domain-containing protein [Gordonia desulfuricans]
MRAERLLSLLMLLKVHERMTATQIADELGVSVRTVLRDIDSLSLSGIPVYAERGRAGGFALLPGYRTDLTGLTADEATSLLAGTGRLDSPAFAAALRKVAAALPEAHRAQAVRSAQRVLVRPEGFVRSPQNLDALGPVQQAVFDGRRIRIRYRRPDQASSHERILDPVGLIVAGDIWYLVANTAGEERLYRISRMSVVEILDQPARRDPDVDLAEIWERRRREFRGLFESVDVVVRCAAEDVVGFEPSAQVGAIGEPDEDGRVRVTLGFGDRRMAVKVLWMGLIERDFQVLAPDWIREAIRRKAEGIVVGHDARSGQG